MILLICNLPLAMLISPVLSLILTAVIALAAMAFFTLLERKILGYVQLRKGPNKVGLIGIPQPLADALKLFLKEITRPTFANSLPYLCAPLLGLFLALLLWSLYPHSSPAYHITFGLLLFLAISRINVYTTLVAGWASNSKYALLGALRGAAQTISYEVRMSLIILCPLIIFISLNFNTIFRHHYTPLITMLPALLFTWFTTSLAETNRTPFDFAEGESELVSGFNTEYRGGPFAAIFMAEYINILFIRVITALLFCSTPLPAILKDLFFVVFTTLFAILFLWARGTLPRIRYDRLIALTWKGFLPFALGALLIILNIITWITWYCAGSNG